MSPHQSPKVFRTSSEMFADTQSVAVPVEHKTTEKIVSKIFDSNELLNEISTCLSTNDIKNLFSTHKRPGGLKIHELSRRKRIIKKIKQYQQNSEDYILARPSRLVRYHKGYCRKCYTRIFDIPHKDYIIGGKFSFVCRKCSKDLYLKLRFK